MWFDGVRAVKNYRQAKIKAIVEAQSIETQEELAAILREQKIDVTQATVSRDIKELHLVKVPCGITSPIISRAFSVHINL